MEYPGTRFTRVWRLIILIFCVATFMIITPIILFYTVGYHYDWRYGFIRASGGLSIDINPKKTIVYINGKKISDSVPLRLTGLNAGRYRLRLSATGYYDWEKEMIIENKRTTYLKDIALIKKTTPNLIDRNQVNRLSISTDGAWLAFASTQKSGYDVYIYNTASGLVNLITTSPADRPPDLLWSRRDHYLVITPAAPPLFPTLLINANHPAEVLKPMPPITRQTTKIEWSPQGSPVLYYGSTSSLHALNVVTDFDTTLGLGNFSDWLIDDATGQVWLMRPAVTGTPTRSIIKDALGFASIVASITDSENQNLNKLSLVKAENDTAIIKSSNPDSIFILNQNKRQNLKVNSVVLSPFNHWWLLWSPWELWGYTQNDKEPYLLARSGEGIREVVPLDEFNTLAISWEKKVTVLFPYYLFEETIIDHPVTTLVADTKNKILYYSDQTGLWKLNY